MGFLDDLLGGGLLGTEDPGEKRRKRIDADNFKRAILRNATGFAAMARAGLDIGPQGRGVIAQARRMGLIEPMKKGLPRSVHGVPVRGQQRTDQILNQLSSLFAGKVRTPKQVFGIIPKLPPNTPDISLSQRQVEFPTLRNPRIGSERSLFRNNDINDLLGFGFDDDFLE